MDKPPPAPEPAAPSFPPPQFPSPPAGKPVPKAAGGPRPLVLPSRASPLQRARDANEATAEARRYIDTILAQSRPPWGGSRGLSGQQIEDLEKAVRSLEAKVAERDLAVAEAQAKLADRERELAEVETLLAARERVIEAARQEAATGPVSAEQEAALRKLKEELDRQENSLKEQRQSQKEREEFLEQSEAALFAKMQEQQEKETELEQLAEDLKRKARHLGLLKDEPPEPVEKA